MIVVIDTNVCVSAFLFASKRGTPAQALGKAISADVIATCDEIDAEFLRILTEKFQWKPPLAFEALETMRKRIVRVKIYGTVSLCRDPDDNKILECAARAKADFIISGDKDLLALKSHAGIKIVTPAEYLQLPLG